MKKLPPSSVIPGHPDYEVLTELARRLVIGVGGFQQFKDSIPKEFRKAVDEVVDTPRTGRRAFKELSKVEKTYIGTKVEILIKKALQLSEGAVLDVNLGGIELDIKNTTGNNWMIPMEAVNHPCLLISLDESKFICSVGIIIARPNVLSVSENRDRKRCVSAAGFSDIFWLLQEHPYPPNFWESVEAKKAATIFQPSKSATQRLATLFANVVERPVSREVVAGVAQQQDYMKRLRWNGGARDVLWGMRIALLSGKYHGQLIRELSLPYCRNDEFISVKITSERHENILRKYRYFSE